MVIPVGTRAAQLDLFIQKGSDFKKTLTFTGEDFTGEDARAQIRSSIGSSDIIVDLTVGSGITLATADVVLEISATDTEAVGEDAGVWDLELIIGGKVIRVLEGNVTFDNEVTR